MAGNADQQTSPTHHGLIALVQQVARADRRALARLHDRLAPAVAQSLRAVVPDPAEAAAITSATFVEVWLLARFHTADTDVPAWILGIALRRAGERLPAGPGTGTGDPASAARRPSFSPVQTMQDRRHARTLAALLRDHVPAARPAGHQPDGSGESAT